MVDIKRAVGNAIEFAQSTLEPERTKDLRLEEVESSTVDGRDLWLITLSVPRGEWTNGLKSMGIQVDPWRDYKVFSVAKDSGDVLSMKIRVLSAPAA